MPNFYNEGYMKQGLAAGDKGHSLGRSQGSLYGNKEELYDRLKRHAYQPSQPKKGEQASHQLSDHTSLQNPNFQQFIFSFPDKSSANETTSDSDDARQ